MKDRFCAYTSTEVLSMKRSVPLWQMAGFVFTGILGTFLHFLFDLTSGNVIAALFSAVNESIWEHMKLLFYPMLLFALIEYFAWGKEVQGFWNGKLQGILLGLALIPVLYYTYTGILGVSADWFNIAIFFIAAGVAYWRETKLFQKGITPRLPSYLAAGIVAGIGIGFTVLTFFPLPIPLFQDPLSGTYGFLTVKMNFL